MVKILKIESGHIRSVFDPESKKIFYSIVDSVGIASGSRDPRNYWKVLKNRLKRTQNQLVTECNQLKMKSTDGKSYLTDVAEADVVAKIIELISPDYISHFWRYFDNDTQNLSKMHIVSLSTPLETKISALDNNVSYPQLNLEESKNSNESIKEFHLLVDAYCTNNFIFIKAFTAGVSKENISINVTTNSITISGVRNSPLEGWLKARVDKILPPPPSGTPQEENLNHEGNLIQELSWGKFSRTLDLPQEIKANEMEVKENNEDGLLIIKLPLLLQNPNKKLIKMRTI